MSISLCLTPAGKTFYEKQGLKAKTFVPISFDESTEKKYAEWLGNLKLLFWVMERKTSEWFVALKLSNITAKWTFII